MNSHNVILVIHTTDEPLSFDSKPLTSSSLLSSKSSSLSSKVTGPFYQDHKESFGEGNNENISPVICYPFFYLKQDTITSGYCRIWNLMTLKVAGRL